MSEKGNPYLVPLAILLAGVIIAGAVIYSNNQKTSSVGSDFSLDQAAQQQGDRESLLKNALPVKDEDHIRGEKNAPVTLIEFSDFQCPFCKKFHPTMKRALEEFQGKVRWVYRHFPLSQIHPEAIPAALASECIAELGGNDAFWTFTDRIFEEQDRLGRDLYFELAQELGVDMDSFKQCFDSKKYLDKVQAEYQQAVSSGGQGTPFTVIVSPSGKLDEITGALPYEVLKARIEKALEDGGS